MFFTDSDMQGGACSEDTGEDGKKDRQLHMQKRRSQKKHSQRVFVVWDISIIIIIRLACSA